MSDSTPTHSSPNTMALDNLIRRTLRVSDPRNATEIATALRNAYGDAAALLDRESAGLSFQRTPLATPGSVVETASRVELKQALDDVQRDLQALITNALLKDTRFELEGWASAIRSAIANGTAAARFALDPRERDRAFAVRRLLGDYARLARYVGALTPTLSLPYRRLAQSLDEVAAVILVQMGEALANVGYSGGRFLLQVAGSELQERRDAVIYALRNFHGATQNAHAPNEWPRGLVAYRELLRRLEASGKADLRALLQENQLAAAMDELIHWTTSGNPLDLRALGATAHLALGRFRHLIQVGQRLVNPESPPLANFLSALQLFSDAFSDAESGYRLLYIARPPVVFYGLYGVGGLDPATRRLVDLINLRGQLAQQLDCFLGCDCSPNRVQCQIMLDKILYDVDRAIDLYTLGSDPQGEGDPEHRAAAYGAVIEAFLRYSLGTEMSVECSENYDRQPRCVEVELRCLPEDSALADLLREIRRQLWVAGSLSLDAANILSSTLSPDQLEDLQQELCIQRDAQGQWENLLHTMAPSCLHAAGGVLAPVEQLIDEALAILGGSGVCPEFSVSIPRHYETSLESLVDDRDGDGTSTGL